MSLLLLLRNSSATVTPPTLVGTAEAPYGTTGTSKTSGSVSVNQNDVLAVVALASDPVTFSNIDDTDGNTWTLQQSINVSQFCSAYVWTATANATDSITVSMDSSSSAAHWGFTVYVWRGSSGVGNSNKTNVASGAPSLALTTAQDNSAILTGNGDWNAGSGTSRTWRTVNSITPTSGNGLETKYLQDTSFYTVYEAYWNDAGTAGSKTVGLSAPTGQKYSIVAVEIKGSTAAPVSKSLTETGSGTDALSVTSATPLTETSSGTDVVSVAVSATLSETSTASDALSVTVTTSLTDTGSATDSLSWVREVSLTETGTGSDSISVTATVALTDTSSGTDSVSESATVSLSDTSTGTDALSITASISLADTSAGVDALSESVALTLTDTASATDAVTIAAAVTLTDTGTGTDSVSVDTGGSQSKSLTETATAVDALTVTVTVSLSETGTATDSVGETATISLTDTATAVDSLSAGVPKTLTETGSGADSISASVSLSLSETGSSADAVSVTATTLLVDSGTASDVLSVASVLSLSDTATSTDSLSVAWAIGLTESVSSVESFVVTRVVNTPGHAIGGIGTTTRITSETSLKITIRGSMGIGTGITGDDA